MTTQTKPGETCIICGASIYRQFHANKRCKRCYQWLSKHGTERPPDVKPRGQRAKVCFCKVCGGTHYAKNLCSPCYVYFRKHGRNRPRDMWRTTCKICDRPLSKGLSKVGARRSRGRCQACSTYWHANHKERPPEVCQRYAPLGWCDCGQPGIKEITFKTNSRINRKTPGSVHSIVLCPGCLAEWDEDL